MQSQLKRYSKYQRQSYIKLNSNSIPIWKYSNISKILLVLDKQFFPLLAWQFLVNLTKSSLRLFLALLPDQKFTFFMPWWNPIGRMQGSWIFFILLPKNLSWKVMGKSHRVKSEMPWLRRNRASKLGNWPTKSRWKDRGIVCPQRQSRAGRVLLSGHGNSLSNPCDLVDQFQGSDTRFLLSQGVSDFALWDFPITFQDKFFGNKMKIFHDPCIRPIQTNWLQQYHW